MFTIVRFKNTVYCSKYYHIFPCVNSLNLNVTSESSLQSSVTVELECCRGNLVSYTIILHLYKSDKMVFKIQHTLSHTRALSLSLSLSRDAPVQHLCTSSLQFLQYLG